MTLSRLVKGGGAAEMSAAKLSAAEMIAAEISAASTCKNEVVSKDE